MQKLLKVSGLAGTIAVVILFAAMQAASVRAAAAPQGNQSGPEHFTAAAMNLDGSMRAAARQVDIDIKQWSTDGQRDELLNILRTKGEEAMLTALQKMPVVGTIRTPDSLAYDLHYARKQPWGDGGQQLLIATDRPIGFWEASGGSRSLEYPFTVIQIRVNAQGKGEGRMSVATKVIPEGNTIVLENYNAQPVLLSDVTRGE